MITRVDNSALVVPHYDSIDSNAVFPCNTDNMKYDKNDHRYYLTEAGITHYGIDYGPSEVIKLIRTTTDHIYSYIAIMAQTNYNLMCYRIARSLFGRFKTAKEGRIEFERMLAIQAEYISDYGDAKKAPKLIVSPDSGRVRDSNTDYSTGFWLNDEVLLWLKVNNLLDPNTVNGLWRVEWDKY